MPANEHSAPTAVRAARRGRRPVTDGLRSIRRWTIANAVLAVIDRKGMDAFTVKDIADEVGVAKGTLYLYFPSRDRMLFETSVFARRKLALELARTFSRPGSLEERLTALIANAARLLNEQPALFRLARCNFGDPEQRDSKDSWGREWYREELLRLFDDARWKGEIRDVPPATIATFLLDWFDGLVDRRLDESQPIPFDLEMQSIASVVIHGLSPGSRAE